MEILSIQDEMRRQEALERRAAKKPPAPEPTIPEAPPQDVREDPDVIRQRQAQENVRADARDFRELLRQEKAGTLDQNGRERLVVYRMRLKETSRIIRPEDIPYLEAGRVGGRKHEPRGKRADEHAEGAGQDLAQEHLQGLAENAGETEKK